jgi:hypothetical protein
MASDIISSSDLYSFLENSDNSWTAQSGSVT